MSKKSPRIELSFGKNDMDLLQWITEKELSNATFVKRVLREKMNEEKAGTISHSVDIAPQKAEPVIVQNEEESASFAFISKMDPKGKDM